MEAFAVRDLREHTGELVRNAENGAYSVVSKHGKPLFVALPFNDDLLKSGVNVALADKLVRQGELSVAAGAKLADAAFAAGLGGGEIAVLAYAKAHGLLALIDERRARRVAARLKVAVIGSGTVLAQLKRQGRIDSVQPVFAAWGQHGYFISELIKRDIQRLSGEA
jgi:prevent-host-death family protein